MVRLFICLAAFTAIQECVATVIPMQCPAGFHRINATSNFCVTCPDRTYAKESNSDFTCHDCTTCSSWQKIINECSATHDVVCGCYEGYVLSTDGCVRETADQDPRLNFTASVERIVKYLEYLRTTLNDTHGGIILDMSRELEKLNQSLSGVLYRIETLTIQIAQSESSKLSNLTGLNQMLEEVSNTHEKAMLSYRLSGTIFAFLLSSLLVNYVLVWKGKQYFSKYLQQIEKELPKNEVSKDVQQIRKALFDNEVPSAPRNLHRTRYNRGTSLYLAWDEPTDSGSPNTVISCYKLYYAAENMTRPKEVQIYDRREHELTNLQPDTAYVIYVKAFSNGVDGPPSNKVQERTDSLNLAGVRPEDEIAPEESPDERERKTPENRALLSQRQAGPAPQNLRLTQVTSSSLTLAWDAPTQSLDRAISGYKLYYTPTDSRLQIEVQIHGFCEATLTNLQPNTAYVICVTAFSDDVDGQPSEKVTMRTSLASAFDLLVNAQKTYSALAEKITAASELSVMNKLDQIIGMLPGNRNENATGAAGASQQVTAVDHPQAPADP